MADLLTGPIREGNRGGHGLFRWENVKEDKYRENYLGHSLRAPVGRWQKGRDLTWYTKGKKEAPKISRDERDEEIRRIKEAEKDALAEALGFKVEKKTAPNTIIEDISNALDRANKEAEINAVDVAMKDIHTTEGIGFRTKTKRWEEASYQEISKINTEISEEMKRFHAFKSEGDRERYNSHRDKYDRAQQSCDRYYKSRDRSRNRNHSPHSHSRYRKRSRYSSRSPRINNSG
ncbi:hypothetical protein PCANB_000509 [Pneumocystis canis]|nr:hypothetical protein PCK1_000459 [Pneumocystis canis]KAG5437795.1 hypothetical protein PCANB_000509 [Pneumocystis canis]